MKELAAETLYRSYEALGLLATPNPRLAGGLEPLPITPFAYSASAAASTSAITLDDEPQLASEPPQLGPEGQIPKGYARIVRDAAGNIISVTLADEDADDAAAADKASADPETTAWGQPLRDINDPVPDEDRPVDVDDEGMDRRQGIPMPDGANGGVYAAFRPAKEPTKVVQGQFLM